MQPTAFQQWQEVDTSCDDLPQVEHTFARRRWQTLHPEHPNPISDRQPTSPTTEEDTP